MLSIAAPSMLCEANRPLTSHSERNRNQTRVKNYPAFTMPACLLTATGRCMRRWLCENGGGCTIRTHGRPEAAGGFQNRCNKPLCQSSGWLRRSDLNTRPLAYETSELPDCSTAQCFGERGRTRTADFPSCCRVATAGHVSREHSNLLSYPLVVFRLPFVKERWYYRIHHPESQGQKNTPCRLWSAGRSAVAE